MYPYKQAVAEFWAKLASIAEWDDVTEPYRRALRAEYSRLCFALGNAAVNGAPLSAKRKQKQFAALTEQYRRHAPRFPASYDVDLARFHAIAQQAIVPLVKGQPATLPEERKATRQVRLADDGSIVPVTAMIGGADILINELVALLGRDNPCPFLLCGGCGRVFVPTTNQRYCSKACADHAWLKTNNESRRDYMKEYMKQRREAARKAAA
jgi:hypothetical protein